MLLKILKNVYNFILIVVKKMTSSTVDQMDTDTKNLYTFKAFKYKEIKPLNCNNNTRIPYPRSGHRIGADSANFYSFGGYNPLIPNSMETSTDDYYAQSFPLFRELWKFNYASRQWSKYPNRLTLPLELASNALLLHRNCLLVVKAIEFQLIDIKMMFSRFMEVLVHHLVFDVAINCMFVK